MDGLSQGYSGLKTTVVIPKASLSRKAAAGGAAL